MRRLRPCLVSTDSGGRGSPSVLTMERCLRWLDAGWMKVGESLPDQVGLSPSSSPRKHGPPDRNRRRGAPEGDARDAFIARCGGCFERAVTTCASRRAAPLILSTAIPRRSNNRGDEAWLFEN